MPYEIVYGRPPLTLLSYVSGTAQVEAVNQELRERDQFFKELRTLLQANQNSMTKVFMMLSEVSKAEVGILGFYALAAIQTGSNQS